MLRSPSLTPICALVVGWHLSNGRFSFRWCGTTGRETLRKGIELAWWDHPTFNCHRFHLQTVSGDLFPNTCKPRQSCGTATVRVLNNLDANLIKKSIGFVRNQRTNFAPSKLFICNVFRIWG